MMNQLKAYAVSCSVHNLVTFADMSAVGYFKKQGFSLTLTLPPEQVWPFIKEYEGGAAMQCVLHARVAYADLGAMVARHRLALALAVTAREQKQRRYPGLTVFAEGKSFIPIEDICGVVEAGWRPNVDDEVVEVSATSGGKPNATGTGPGAGGGGVSKAATTAAADKSLQAWIRQGLFHLSFPELSFIDYLGYSPQRPEKPLVGVAVCGTDQPGGCARLSRRCV
jgi:hypothetical protein